MQHPRQQIRAAAASAINALATYVYTSRVYPHDGLPSLTVLTPLDVHNEAAAICGRLTVEDCQLVVEARAMAAVGMDDTLDALCASVEGAIIADSTIAGITDYLEYQGTDIEMEDGLQQPLGVARMVWKANYSTLRTLPTFSNVGYEQGETALAFTCDTSRMGKIRIKLQNTIGEGGAPHGAPVIDDWELTSKITGHGVLVDGLVASRWWQAFIMIDADTAPDLDTWTLLDDGVTGPNFQTGPPGFGNPPDPENP